jgi:hypothetical protein
MLGISLVPAQANLGETVAQIVARYGHPSGYAEASAASPFGRVVFSAGGYEMVIFLYDNKEVGARISKTDKSPFSDADMQNIMANDLDGSKWSPVASTDPSCLQWTRNDKATVLYDKDNHTLMFTSQAMTDVIASQKVKAGN